MHPAVRQGHPVRIFPLAHHVAVLWDTDVGRAAISVLGRPGLVYRHGLRFIAAEGGDLWVTANTGAAGAVSAQKTSETSPARRFASAMMNRR